MPAELEPVLLRHPRSTRPRSSRCPTSGSASARARRSSSRPASGAPTLAELQEFLEREGVAKYTWPESVEVFDEFPRTPSLKVVKREVVQTIVSRATARSDGEPEGVLCRRSVPDTLQLR